MQDLNSRERFALLIGVVYGLTAELGLAGLLLALGIIYSTLRRR